jgi:hypothetical protein
MNIAWERKSEENYFSYVIKKGSAFQGGKKRLFSS